MLHLGMTGIRLNLSHSKLEDCAEWLHNLRTASEAIRIVPDLLLDLQGPEVRIGVLDAPLVLENGDSVLFTAGSPSFAKENAANSPFTKQIIPVPPEIFPHLSAGQTIRLDDGKIILQAEQTDRDALCATAKVLTGGTLFSRKSLSIDGVSLRLPTLTKQDKENLSHASRFGVTGVMLPFVRDADDLFYLKQTLMQLGLAHIRIFAKIENRAGVEQLSSLLPHCDEIVIARGDLGNAYPLSKLPAVQKDIARTCLLAKKPFMVVTQMLASMETHPIPTRAEVSDIFNAVMDGASSLMLTGETAAGQYPVQAMKTLADTSYEALRYRMQPRFPFAF